MSHRVNGCIVNSLQKEWVSAWGSVWLVLGHYELYQPRLMAKHWTLNASIDVFVGRSVSVGSTRWILLSTILQVPTPYYDAGESIGAGRSLHRTPQRNTPFPVQGASIPNANDAFPPIFRMHSPYVWEYKKNFRMTFSQKNSGVSTDDPF